MAGKNRVAVVGCGLAGMVAATLLKQFGHDVSILEKSRGVGGRLASKRSPHGLIDFGAQYFTCSTFEFEKQVEKWITDGTVSPWAVTPAVIDSPGNIQLKESKQPKRYIGCPTMKEMAKKLESELQGAVLLGKLITKVQKTDAGKWTLFTDSESFGEFDTLILNVPPKQALPFLSDVPEIRDKVESVEMNPCWAVSLSFEKPLDISIDCAFVNYGKLSWIAKNSSKKDRTELPETWVLHGNIHWCRENIEETPENVEKALASEFFEAVGIAPRDSLYSVTHKWRYSIAKNPLDCGYLFSSDMLIGVCGDWCNGGKVEGAFMSGYLLANAIHAKSSL